MGNYQIYQLETNLKQLILDSGLTPAVLRLILHQLAQEMDNLYLQAVEAEYNQQEKIKSKLEEGLSEKVQEELKGQEVTLSGQE